MAQHTDPHAQPVPRLLATGVGITVLQPAAEAHGAMMVPGSRTYFFWKDGLSGTNGAIVPKNPACAACHAAFDSYGLTFEIYDAIGRYRTTESGKAIDATGKNLPGGFTDVTLLKATGLPVAYSLLEAVEMAA